MGIDIQTILIFTVGIFGGLITFFSLEWGLFALVFMTFTRLSDVFVNYHHFPSIAKIFIPVVLAVILVRWIIDGKRVENIMPMFFILASYGIIGLFSLLYATDPSRSQSALITFAKDALIMTAIVLLIQRGKLLRYAIWGILAGGIFLGTIGSYQYLTQTFDNDYWGFGESRTEAILSDSTSQEERLGGPGIGPNGFGRYMLVPIPLAFDRFWNEKKNYLKILAAWAFFVSLLALIFTFSRGSFLGLVAVFLIMLFLSRPSRPRVTLGIILVGILMIPIVPKEYFLRLAELQELLPGRIEYEAPENISFRGRLSENISAWTMFTDHPIVGVGLNNFENNYQEYSRRLGLDPRREERSAHNFFLEILAEQGILGFIWFIGFQWIVFKGLIDSRKISLDEGNYDYSGMYLAIAATLIGFLITGLFLQNTHARLFWLIYGLALAVPQEAKEIRDHIGARAMSGTGVVT